MYFVQIESSHTVHSHTGSVGNNNLESLVFQWWYLEHLEVSVQTGSQVQFYHHALIHVGILQRKIEIGQTQNPPLVYTGLYLCGSVLERCKQF